MIPNRAFHLLFLLQIVFAASPAELISQEDRKIIEISIEGNARVYPSLIRDNLKTKVGDVYSDDVSDEDIRMIFERFRVQADFIRIKETKGDHIIIRLHDETVIRSMIFRGVDEDDEKKLKELLGLDDDVTPDRYQLRSYSVKLRDHYRKDGYYFAEVNPILRPVEGGAELVFDIYKGEKVTVDEVVFHGAEQVDPDHLEKIMTLEAPTLWIFTHKLKDDILKQDIALLNNYMRREGYLDAEVSLDSLEFNDDLDGVTIHMLVKERERFFVRNIEVEGCEAFFPDEIKELIQIQPGDPYREVKIERDVFRIERFYRDRGYIRVNVRDPELSYDKTKPLVDLKFRIKENNQKTLRDVIITGNTLTKDKVIRREVTLYPGDIMDHSEIRWSVQQLRGLQYFTDDRGTPKVDIITRPTDDPQLEDLFIHVDEGGTGFFKFSFGVSTDTGLIGGVDINKRNFDYGNLPDSPLTFPGEFFTNEAFHGGGQNLRLQLMPGTVSQNYSLSFFEPYFYDTQPYPITLSIDLYRRYMAFSDYDERRAGINPELGKRWSRKLYTTLGIKLEQVHVYHLSDVALEDIKNLKGKNGIRELQGGIYYKDLDRPYLPSSGYSTFLNYDFSGNFLGGDVELSRAIAGGTVYIPAYEDEAGKKHVLALKGTFGWVEPHDGSDEVPYFERFFVGGVSSRFPLRGFKYREAGPHKDGQPLGGGVAVAMSAEYSIPLYSDYDPYLDVEDPRLKGVVFFDMGNTAADVHDNDLFGRLRSAYGVGLKIRLPVLGGFPISLYYGIPFKKYPGDERRSFNIDISNFF